MAYEPKDMTGTLFNEKQKKSDRAPDMTGTVLLNGVTMRIAAWKKAGRSGEFLSLVISEQRARTDAPAAAPVKSVADDLDDSIPF